MSKHYSKKRRLKYVFLALACTASFSLTGLAAACSKPDTSTEDEKTTSKEDTQLLKNGNFEFFNVPEQKEGSPAPVYLISTPTNWSQGGTSSYTKSGIIGTSEKAWEKIADSGLKDALDYNNALNSGDSDYDKYYVDYNGMKSSDILYKDTYAAITDEDDDDDADHEHDMDLIENPGTRYNVQKKDGKLYGTKDGEEFEVFEDENGDYFFDKDFKEPFSHVLMLHNYATAHNGIAQHYSSVSVDLPANTAAEISVWVKTSYLLFDQGREVTQDRGANISVTQTVGGSTLDKFTISSINTEKLNPQPENGTWMNNGWVEYTVYVNACDFASSTVSIELGLGEDKNIVEGYAFFDDITVKKFVSLDDEGCTYGDHENDIKTTSYQVDKNVTRKAYCTISSDESEKVFKADTYKRNNGAVNYERFSDCYHYLIDLASESEHSKVVFGNNLKAGLTVDEDNYVSSGSVTNNKFYSNYAGEHIGITLDQQGGVKLPTDFTAINTNYDLLANVNAGYEFKSSDSVKSQYYAQLNEALSSATKLPNGDGDNNVLVMFSAYGAAYTTSFQLDIDGEGYKIISFWVKTSDMDGSTAATVKIAENGNDDNFSNVSVDSTGIVTDIDDDNKDIYDGWVQCFLFVHNENKETKTVDIEFSFGNTTIKSTTGNSYKAGWAALANLQTLDVDEDTFGYTGSGDHTASLTITEKEDKQTAVFDEVYGSQKHEIENGIVNPSTYTGVNGQSSRVVNNGHVSIPYDSDNSNNFAGLINKEYFVKGNYNSCLWYNKLLNSFNASHIDAIDNWNEVFGQKSVQPLIIINQTRESYVTIKNANESNYKNYLVKNDEGKYVAVADDAKFDETETYYSRKDVMNYGFIGETKSVSADSYATVSVRVKVSAGAIAYIYLVDTSEGKEVMQFNAPAYSFYYDTDGNVLKAKPDEKASLKEQRENILYTLRDDGLYEDANGNLRANTYNYTELYSDETLEYYNANGEQVSFDNIVSGDSYFDKSGNKLNHYLVTTDGKKIYEYKNGHYHYIVDGVTQSENVLPFEIGFARAEYANISEEFVTVIDGNQEGIANKWITVNFVIHAGSDAKSYRLELWSGERNETSTSGNKEGGSVIFDYSYTSISDDTLRDEYENEIILAYQKLLLANGVTGFDTSTENISYYEGLVKDNKLEDKLTGILKEYNAHYYTYSLYDSANFQPYNATVASADSTGYDYSADDYSESLAYFSIKDDDIYNVFVDYSAIDQSISLDSTTDSDDDDDDNDNSIDSNVWLLVSSILLVIALLFAMIAIFVKDMLKKNRRNKVTSKNTYNHNKTSRHTKKNKNVSEEVEVEESEETNTEEPAVEGEEEITETEENTEESVEETQETEAPEEPETSPEEGSDEQE